MGYGINETIVLLILADLADQEAGIQNEAGNDGAEEEYPKDDFDVLLPVENNPAKADTNRDRCQQYSDGQEECHFAAPANSGGFTSSAGRTTRLLREVANSMPANRFSSRL